jgi:hypothetical protein
LASWPRAGPLASRLLALARPEVRHADGAARRHHQDRYRVETSNGQLAERYGVKRTWAKDLWHLCHRVVREILSHTTLALINLRSGRQPMQLAGLAA